MRKGLFRELLVKETLTDKLLSVVDDYEIYTSLIGCDVELGERINSPIRGTDDFPSFALFVPTRKDGLRPEEIWYKDLAEGSAGDVFKFIKQYAAHQFGEDLFTRGDAIKFIDRQLQLGMFTAEGPVKVAQKRVFEAKVTTNLYYKSRSFTTTDLDYWGKLGQTKEDLDFWGVKSVRYLLAENGLVRKEFRHKELCFVYEFFDKEKLYQPQATRAFKFRNTCPGDDYRYYQGFKQLRGRDNGVKTLIVTKSMKDVMVFYKYFNEKLGIPVDVIAPHAESINLSEKFVDGVKGAYDRIICVSDFDLAGVKFANQCKRFGFEPMFVDTNRVIINGKAKVIDKDVSDYLTNWGEKKTLKLLKSWELDAI
jgi:hypothetical protein